MPELPEVEHARRSLEHWLRGATLTVAVLHEHRIGRGTTARAFGRALLGRHVLGVERRGKWLRLVLDEGFLFSHLGMTGKWVRAAPDDEPLRFERARLDGKLRGRTISARYLDPRMFGSLRVAKEDLPAWRALGPDPLHDGIDVDDMLARLARRSGAIKPALLDQSLIAGVGNIQATEALFFARIDPRRAARSLSRKEVAAVVRGILRSIKRTLSIESGPSITYVEEPGAKNPFLVYDRGDEPCPRCRRPLHKIVQAGRSTTFCSHCQR
jgi:formamidopyrimidine-DNA glycosylase